MIVLVQRVLIFLLLAWASVSLGQAPETDFSPDEVLEQFIGRWQGSATARFPRRPERALRQESVVADCKKALKATYVECRSQWTSTEGAIRELRMFWNFHPSEGQFEILYLYDNWPGKVQYLLEYDAEARTLTGRDSFEGPGGIAAEEVVTWQFAEDGQSIKSSEQNHYVTDPDDYWPTTFEFTWRRQ